MKSSDKLTLGAWLSMTKENPKPEEKRWYGLEMLRKDFNTIEPHIYNSLGVVLMTVSLLKDERVHVDIYVNQKQIDKLYELVDRLLIKKDEEDTSE